jgi:hypothetical protein
MRLFLSLAGFVVIPSLISVPVQATVPKTPTSETQAQPEARTFTGIILKSGESFILSDPTTKSRYMLDDQNKASRFEGKHVKVTGTIDVASNTIHVETIDEIV